MIIGILVACSVFFYKSYQRHQTEKLYDIVSIQHLYRYGEEEGYFKLKRLDNKEQLKIYFGEMTMNGFSVKVEILNIRIQRFSSN